MNTEKRVGKPTCNYYLYKGETLGLIPILRMVDMPYCTLQRRVKIANARTGDDITKIANISKHGKRK